MAYHISLKVVTDVVITVMAVCVQCVSHEPICLFGFN